MNTAVFANLMAFLQKLEEAEVYYALAHHHDGAIMVEVAVSEERWEVEYLADGAVMVERFIRDQETEGEEALSLLMSKIEGENS